MLTYVCFLLGEAFSKFLQTLSDVHSNYVLEGPAEVGTEYACGQLYVCVCIYI
jgi:hypothetical protein